MHKQQHELTWMYTVFKDATLMNHTVIHPTSHLKVTLKLMSNVILLQSGR